MKKNQKILKLKYKLAKNKQDTVKYLEWNRKNAQNYLDTADKLREAKQIIKDLTLRLRENNVIIDKLSQAK